MSASCRDYQLALVRSACPADAVIEVLLHDKLGSVQAPNRTGADIDGVGCYCCGFSLDHFFVQGLFQSRRYPPAIRETLSGAIARHPSIPHKRLRRPELAEPTEFSLGFLADFRPAASR
jgi:hypothetical protein